jgi:hypothetical protein
MVPKVAGQLAATPMQRWPGHLLAFSAGYWEGHARTAKHWKSRARWRRWANEAQAELLARKLAAS